MFHVEPTRPFMARCTFLEKLAAMQLLDVHFPTTDGRELPFTRYTARAGSATPPRPTRMGPA